MFAACYTGMGDTAARTGRIVCLILARCPLATAGAGNTSSIEISVNPGMYRVKMVMPINAPAQYVSSVLTDYKYI